MCVELSCGGGRSAAWKLPVVADVRPGRPAELQAADASGRGPSLPADARQRRAGHDESAGSNCLSAD